MLESAAGAPPSTPLRTAAVLGAVGALGEELLAALLGSMQYSRVHVAVSQPIGSTTARFHPWIVGQGAVVADDAFICVTGPETIVPAASPMQRVAPQSALDAARRARATGASRLVLVSPLATLLQLNAATRTLSNASEIEIAELGFRTLVVVRPAADVAVTASGWPRALVRTLAKMVLEIMLPQRIQPLRASTAALAILEAMKSAGPGIHVLGAADLTAIVEARMPHALRPRRRLR